MMRWLALGLLLVSLLVVACGSKEAARQEAGEQGLPVITVYKSPT